MATASPSGMEWLTAMNSQSNEPNVRRSPSATSTVRGVMRCSASFDSRKARVSREPTTGMSGRSAAGGHAADVVLVAVGEHDRVDLVEAVPDPLEVGDHHVDARLVLVGEEHPAVDDQQAALVLEDGHVATDLAEAAQRHDPQPVRGSAGSASLLLRGGPRRLIARLLPRGGGGPDWSRCGTGGSRFSVGLGRWSRFSRAPRRAGTSGADASRVAAVRCRCCRAWQRANSRRTRQGSGGEPPWGAAP